MSLPAKTSKSQLFFDPNVYTINGNSGVRNTTQERETKKECLSHVTYMKGCSGRKNKINN